MMNYTQCETILKIMLENPSKEWWSAKDFQKSKYFIGYEATARMSDLIRMYPTLFNITKDGRFRIIAINWDNVKMVRQFKKLFDL